MHSYGFLCIYSTFVGYLVYKGLFFKFETLLTCFFSKSLSALVPSSSPDILPMDVRVLHMVFESAFINLDFFWASV